MGGSVGEVRGPSLRARFAVAVALTVVFYVLAIGIALAMIAIPVWGWIDLHHFNLWLTFFLVAGGLTILRAIIPRRQPFVEPGLRIDETGQKRLTELVSHVARATDQNAPDEIYATLEANAGVMQVGGGLRGHGKRVLVVGLPLLRILTVSELRAVLAHEFGHYAGGDTRIGTWTYRTRATIGYTIASLHDEDSWGMRMVQRPFIWYGNAFLRITNAISRRQEFAADAWAARIAGRDVHMSTLRKLHRLAPAHDAYWDQEVTPALRVGAVPPFGAGFAQFVATPKVAEACDKSLARELEVAKSDPYSSHPTLPERLAAVETLPAGEQAADDTPAVSLLDSPEQLERATLDRLARNADPGALESIDWQDVGDRVYRRLYEEMVAERPRVIEGVTTVTIADAVRDPGAIARRVFGQGVREDTHPIVLSTLGAGLVLALVRQGWAIDAQLGEPVTCIRGEERIDPFKLLFEMASGEMSAERWAEVRASHGIDDAPLGGTARAEEVAA